MEYYIEAVINFYYVKIKLEEEVNLRSPDGATITLSSQDDDGVKLQLRLEAEEMQTAKKKAKRELDRICSLLSYFYDFGVRERGITFIREVATFADGERQTKGYLSVPVEACIVADISFGAESARELSDRLAREYSPDFEETASMWREAISEQADTLKYLGLYKLLEKLCGGRRGLEEWIKTKEPSVQIVEGDRKGSYTIYTHLRDRMVHPSGQSRALNEIADHLRGLEKLVKQAIGEKYPEAQL